MHSNVKYQIFTMEKTSSQKFLREYYFAISKIKLPQEFHATRYLSIKLITLRVPVLLFSSISPSELSSRGSSRSGFYWSIKNIFLFCRCFWRGVRSNDPRPNFLARLLRPRTSITFFLNVESVRCSFWTLSLA